MAIAGRSIENKEHSPAFLILGPWIKPGRGKQSTEGKQGTRTFSEGMDLNVIWSGKRFLPP